MMAREATREDAPAIRNVAQESMYASYSLSPSAIDGAIDEWYGDESFRRRLNDDERLLLVAESDADEVVGLAEALSPEGTREGDILWLHVHPDHRGQGVGRRLFDETREALAEMGGERVRGMVLADNSEGTSFYEHHGLEKVGERRIEIDGRQFVENVYHERGSGELSALAIAGGETVYVDSADASSGSGGAFYAVYEDSNRESRWGYYCTNCESVATAMDSMGRIECADCGNTRKPKRWDAAYL